MKVEMYVLGIASLILVISCQDKFIYTNYINFKNYILHILKWGNLNHLTGIFKTNHLFANMTWKLSRIQWSIKCSYYRMLRQNFGSSEAYKIDDYIKVLFVYYRD